MSTDTIIGGKLYDEAQYGCVFVPPLKCINEPKQSANPIIKEGVLIDKLIPVEEANKEYSIALYIKKIPLWKNYFIPADSICNPDPIQSEKDLSKCTLLKDNKISDFKILRMKFGGRPLAQFSVNIESFQIMKIFKHLLEGVSLLTFYGIVHRDLHQNNILINNDQVPRIIDFNLSLNIKQPITAKDLRHKYTVIPIQEPPDSTLVNSVALGYNYEKVIDNIIDNKPIIQKMISLLQLSKEELRDDLTTFYSKSQAAQKGDDITWFNTYWTTVDSWAIGANMVSILHKLLLWPKFQSEWRAIGPKIKPILKRMCEVDPIKRIDCVQALAELDPNNYFIKNKATKWLERQKQTKMV